MRLDPDLPSSWIVDPEDVAHRLGVSTAALERSVIEGNARVLIIPANWVEVGGSRVTVHLYDGGWQGTFDLSGQLVAQPARSSEAGFHLRCFRHQASALRQSAEPWTADGEGRLGLVSAPVDSLMPSTINSKIKRTRSSDSLSKYSRLN